MNSSLRLRLLTRADLPFADSVRALARWNQTLDDWQRFLATAPDGCFLAEWNGAPAGTATTTVYGPHLAWISMMLAHPVDRPRCIDRSGSHALYLGPLVAGSAEEGVHLVEALVAQSARQTIFWDIPDQNDVAVKCAKEHGFTAQRPLTRMYLGENSTPGHPEKQFALA